MDTIRKKEVSGEITEFFRMVVISDFVVIYLNIKYI